MPNPQANSQIYKVFWRAGKVTLSNPGGFTPPRRPKPQIVRSRQKILHTYDFVVGVNFPKHYMSATYKQVTGTHFPELTLHVFVCDSENYMETSFGTYFLDYLISAPHFKSLKRAQPRDSGAILSWNPMKTNANTNAIVVVIVDHCLNSPLQRATKCPWEAATLPRKLASCVTKGGIEIRHRRSYNRAPKYMNFSKQ